MSSIFYLTNLVNEGYGNDAFEYISENKERISWASEIVGISAMAISGAMAEERDAYSIIDKAVDSLIVRRGYTHDDLLKNYEDNKDFIGDIGYVDKYNNPVLNDVGFANIKLATAIALVRSYADEFPDFELNIYKEDYSLLLEHLIDGEHPITAVLYAIYLKKEAEAFFIEKEAYGEQWDSLSQEFKDSLLITFTNRGRASMERAWQELYINKNLPYEPQPGMTTSGGANHLYNAQRLGGAMGVEGYGDSLNIVSGFADGALSDRADAIAYRYALQKMRSVVIPDLDYSSSNGELSLYDSETDTGEMTKEYIEARAVFLGHYINRLMDINVLSLAGDILFKDTGLDISIKINGLKANLTDEQLVIFGDSSADVIDGGGAGDSLFGGFGNDTITGGEGNDYLEGNSGSDSLYGGADDDNLKGGDGDDYLDGGEDNDTLIGGLGNDTLRGGGGLDLLRGGLGNDRYEFVGNFGTDIIEDEDGAGSLWIGGVQVGALLEAAGAPGVYHDVEERFRAVRVFTDGEWTLAISSLMSEHKGTVFVRGWAEGRLGVTLGEVEAEIPSGSVIVGDIKKKILTEDGTESYVFSATGYESDGEQANAQDILYGTSQADHILGLGGNDGINGGDGDDWIDGGDGDDLLFGGGGADTLLGGAGNDYIFAGRAAEFERPSSVEYVWEPRNGEPIITSGFSWGVVQSLNQDAGSIVYVKRSALSENNAGTVVFGGAGDDVITGGTGEDTLYGGDDNDRVYGLHGNDALFGDAGDDLLVGDGNTQGVTTFQYTAAEHHGNDTLDGGAGNDTLIGQGGHDWLFGGDGDDTLAGDADLTGNTITFIPAERHGNDYLDGGSGNDVLIGGLGNDTLMGGEGNDTLIGGDGVSHSLFGMEDNDWLDGGSGNDELRGRSGDDTLYGGIGNDSLMGDDGNDWLSGDSGNDSLWGGVGDDTLYGGLGDDYVDGGEGQDWLEGGSGNDNIQGMEGDDTLFGGAGGDTLNGGGGNDWLAGGDGDDGLWGKEGNDTLVGGKGLDYLVGGGGDDTYIFNSGDAEVVLASGTVGEQFLSFADTIDDNEGHNTLVLSTVYSLTQIRSKRQENDLILYYGGNEGVIINNGFNGAISTFRLGSGVEVSLQQFLLGTLENIVEYEGGDTGGLLTGGRLADSIKGSIGNDIYEGGLGNDVLEDTGESSADIYRFSLGDGQDTIMDAGGVDRIEFGERIEPSWVTVRSNGLDMVISLITGDSITITNMFDPVTGALVSEHAIETLRFADGVEWNLENMHAEALRDSVHDDILVAFDSADTVSGGLGNDLVYGRNGDDLLHGGEGNDTLHGEQGDDRLEGEAGNDWLSGGLGDDVILGGEGSDILYGNQGNDTLAGGRGDDSLAGGLGNDTYCFSIGDGQDRIIDEGGFDKVKLGEGISSENLALIRTHKDLILELADGSKLTIENMFESWDVNSEKSIELICFDGGEQWDLQRIKQELLRGSDLDDIQRGFSGNDLIDGASGSDKIYGSTGNDTLIGGVGDDSLYGEEDHDLLNGDEGNDYLDGGNGNDILNGGNGNDELFGGNGDDTLIGGAGNDYLSGGSGDDVYHFGLGGGKDTIYDRDGFNRVEFGEGITPESIELSRTSYAALILTLSDGSELTVENMFSEGSSTLVSFINGEQWDAAYLKSVLMQSGSNDHDILYGFESNDSINGEAGNDTIYGGSGDDTLDGSEGQDFLSGDGGNDLLVGGAGDDRLFGGMGDDTLIGGGGKDKMFGGLGNDVYRFGLGDGKDEIEDHGGFDCIEFGEGVTSDNIKIKRPHFQKDGDQLYSSMSYGSSIIITLVDGSELVVRDMLTYELDDISSSHGIELIRFANGEEWDVQRIKEELVRGGDGEDRLLGFVGDDVILGGEGNDTLYGYRGNDILDGGLGDDYLIGGKGDNIYRFSLGFGHDTIDEEGGFDRIELGQDITLDSVQIKRIGMSLVLILADDSRLTISGVLNSQSGEILSSRMVESVYFANGEHLNLLPLLEGASYITDNDDVFYGTTGNDVVDGLAGDDVLYGFSGDDILLGGSGNDTLFGGDDNDVLNGGAGNDSLEGGAGNDVLEGGRGNDRLDGGVGDDAYYFEAGWGDDVIYDHEGRNSIHFTGVAAESLFLRRNGESLLILNQATGDQLQILSYFSFFNEESSPNRTMRFFFDGAETWDLETIKNKVLEGSSGDDNITGTGGNDVIDARAGSDTINGGDGNDTLYGDAGDDLLNGDSGDDHLFGGEGNDTLHGGSGYDQLYGEAGDDHLYGNGVLDGGTGNDYLEGSGLLIGGEGNDTLKGQGFDTLQGGAGDDIIEAYSNAWDQGSNVIEGGAGKDTIYGSFGEDTYIFNLGGGHDLLIERRADQAYSNVEPTADTLSFGEGITASDLTFNRRGLDMVIEHSNGTDSITVQNWFKEPNDHFKLEHFVFADGGELSQSQVEEQVIWHGTSEVDSFIGYRDLNDTMRLGAGDDKAWGRAGDDVMHGEGGNDYLDGEAGNDTIYGGAGNDQLMGGTGNDLLFGGTGDDKYVYKLGDGVDTIDNTGGGNDGVFFSGGIDEARLTFSRDGDDLLILVDEDVEQSVRVLDHFLGGDKAISYVQPDGGFLINAARIAQIVAAGDVPSGFDTLVEGTTAGEQLAGGQGRDLLRGLAGNDTLFGMGGDDQIEGGDGNDYLSGGNGSQSGSGNDILIGGAGNDVLDGEDGDDHLTGGTGDDQYYYRANGGVDVIDNTGGGFDGAFFIGIERTRLSFHREGDDLLILVDGDLGQQVKVIKHFIGGDFAIDYVQPDGGSYITTVQIAGLLTALPDVDTGEPGDGGDPGDGGSNPGEGEEPPVAGVGGDDVLVGTAANDVLIGGAGNDTLSGGAGNDRLLGGIGDDTYVYTAGQDVLEELGGNDTLHFANGITFNQVASGLGKSGNDLVLKVNGSSANQVTLKDFFLGGDSLVETISFETGGQLTAAQIFGAFGLAVPTSSAAVFDSVVQGTSGDDAELSGTALHDLLQGFNGNDQLFGGAGNDRLEGGNGSDTLHGGTGNDFLVGGRGDDTYVFSANGGQDVIDNSGGGADVLHFEGISFNQVSSGLMKSGNDLVLNVSGGSDSVTIKNWFLGGDYVIDTISFSSGGQLTSGQLFGAFGLSNPDVNGSPNYQGLLDERAFGTILAGQSGDQNIIGSSDADLIDGGAGNDTLRGGAGNDYLMGGDGSDTYLFALGDGQDVINNLSNTPDSDTDVLSFESLGRENLWLSRAGDDLVIDVMNSAGSVTVQDWYADSAQQVDIIRAGNSSLYTNQVDALVNAMATFGAPVGGEVSLTQTQQDQLSLVIASTWQ